MTTTHDKALKIRALRPGDDAFPTFESLLWERYERTPRAYGIRGDARDRTDVLGGFVDGRLHAFGIFRDRRGAARHTSELLDAELPARQVGGDDLALVQVALLHGEGSRGELGAAAGALVSAAEERYRKRDERCAFYVTLHRMANLRALPLYHELGFHEVGGRQHLMELDVPALAQIARDIAPLPDDVELRFLDDPLTLDEEGLAECYGEVFLDGLEVDPRDIFEAPDFSRHLSCAIVQGAEERVVGFCLFTEVSRARVHLDAVGILPELQGSRLAYRCVPAIVSRALDHGFHAASFVTEKAWLADFARRSLHARELDRVVTLCRRS